MAMQVLNATNPAEVASATMIEADLGVGNRRLLVISGLAILDWKIDTDEVTGRETRVNLGVYARNLESASPFVGLSYIANDETGFVFAVDQARVELDPGTGELWLYLHLALMGEWSSLQRVGYQVVATVVKAESIISGSISWPTALMRPASADPALVAPALTIVANHRTMGEPDGPFAPQEVLRPVAWGKLTGLEVGDQTCTARYEVVAAPLAMPLKVTLGVAPTFAPHLHGGSFRVTKTAGPDIFTLSPAHIADQVDFAIRWEQIN